MSTARARRSDASTSTTASRHRERTPSTSWHPRRAAAPRTPAHRAQRKVVQSALTVRPPRRRRLWASRESGGTAGEVAQEWSCRPAPLAHPRSAWWPPGGAPQ